MGVNIRQQHQDQEYTKHKRHDGNHGQGFLSRTQMHKVHGHQGAFHTAKNNQQAGEQHFRQTQIDDGDLTNAQDQLASTKSLM